MVIWIVPLIYYILYVDEIEIINQNSLIFLFFSVLYFIFVIVVFIPKGLSVSVKNILYQAGIEEFFFRFCMLGILRKYVKFDSPLSLWSVLLINSILFTNSHSFQNIFQLIPIVQLGIIYGLIYLSVGIGPSIITHALWNIHGNIFLIYPILIPASFVIIHSLLNNNKNKKDSENNQYTSVNTKNTIRELKQDY
jgi:hypothetical protein